MTSDRRVVLCTRHVMPAFVVGFELPARSGTPWTRGLSSSVVLHEHQCGGSCCVQVSLLGITLRFERNHDRPRGPVPLRDLQRGFVSLGEFGHETVARSELSREVAWLEDLAPTQGQDYDEMDRKLLERTIAEAVPGLPPVERAMEALVRFAPGPPKALLGWRVFDVSADGPQTLSDGDFEDARFSETTELTSSRLHALGELGRREGLGPVRTFLLWENSD